MHRILIVGTGSIGERHLRCFKATGRAEVAFVETQPELRATIAERYQARAFTSLDEALREAFTAAVIATPAPLHVPQSLQCVRAGWQVLIEKPLSTTPAGLDELRQEISARKATVGVAYVYRCFPLFLRLVEALKSGEFGRPVQLTAVTGQHFPTFRPAYRTIYYARRESGGGAIQDALTHVMNLGEWLLGPVDRLAADAAHQVLPDVTVEDTVHVIARHGDAMASYALNQHQAPNEMRITVVCDGGTLRAELPTNRFSWMKTPGNEWTVEDFGAMERDSAFISQANRFLDAVEGKSPVPCPLDEGAQTLRVNLATLAAVDQQTWQTP